MAPQPIRRSVERGLLCLVTDRRRLRCGSDGDSRTALVALIEAAASAGVDLIQIRERDLEARVLRDLVRAGKQAVEGTRAKVVVNDRLDVAFASGADGVHLRSDSVAASRIRRLVPEGFLIGRSVHGTEEARDAVRAGGLDYVIAGTVFSSVSKHPAHPGLGLAGLREIVEQIDIPVLAIGGVRESNIPAIADAGAAGLAAIALFHDIGADVAELTRVLRAARRAFDTFGRLS